MSFVRKSKKKVERRKTKKLPISKVNYLMDFAILLIFLLAMEPSATGIVIHEWLGLVFTIIIVVHLLLHWAWIIAISKRFFKKLAGQARLNFVLNIFLFIFITILIFTGIMDSKVILPFLGVRFESIFNWRFLHNFSANIILLILGLHIALHWKWIVLMTRRYATNLIPSHHSRSRKTKTKGDRA